MATIRHMTAALLLVAAAGCGGSEPPRRDCLARVWLPSSNGDATIVGSWDDYQQPVAAERYDERWRLARIELPAGEHGYLLDDGDGRRLDPHNPLSHFDQVNGDDREVSHLEVEDCSAPQIRVEAAELRAGRLTVQARFLASSSGAALDPNAIEARTLDGHTLQLDIADDTNGTLLLSADVAAGKHTVELGASDVEGVSSAVTRASVWREARADTWRDMVVYQWSSIAS